MALHGEFVSVAGGPTLDVVMALNGVRRREDCDMALELAGRQEVLCGSVNTDGPMRRRHLVSTNGTRGNGQRVRRSSGRANEQLSIANYKFLFYLGPDLPHFSSFFFFKQKTAYEMPK